MRSIIVSSLRKCTSRFVGCTFTSTERGSISMLKRNDQSLGRSRSFGVGGDEPEIDERIGAFG
jgi:hypothetical protein